LGSGSNSDVFKARLVSASMIKELASCMGVERQQFLRIEVFDATILSVFSTWLLRLPAQTSLFRTSPKLLISLTGTSVG
jgi:hypothetical protein